MVESAKMLPAHFSFGHGGPDTVSRQQIQDNLGIYSRDNVQRVLDSGGTTYSHEFYSAVARFPAFCGEFKLDLRDNLDNARNACRRELAFFWSLADENYDDPDYMTQARCNPDFHGNLYVDLAEFEKPDYMGMEWGPYRMQTKAQYEQFFAAYTNNVYPDEFAQYPEEVQCNAETRMTAALWMYMTPQAMNPQGHPSQPYLLSVHEIASGMPNNGGFSSFGAAIYLATVNRAWPSLQAEVCDGDPSREPVLEGGRQKFAGYLAFFGLNNETDLGCEAADLAAATVSMIEHQLVQSSTQWNKYYITPFPPDVDEEHNCEAVFVGNQQPVSCDPSVDPTCYLEWESSGSIFNEEGFKQCMCKGGYSDLQDLIDDSECVPTIPAIGRTPIQNWYDTQKCACQNVDYNPCQWHWPEGWADTVPFNTSPTFGSVLAKVATYLEAFPYCITWKNADFASQVDQLKGRIEPINGNELPTRYFLLNLVMDNYGQTVKDEKFREDYLVTTESYLKAEQVPPDMFIARPLGQHSLVIKDTAFEDQSYFDFTAPTLPLTDAQILVMFGDWTFELIPCVDRTGELIGILDCEHGNQKIKLVVNENCSDPDVDLVAHPECDPSYVPPELQPAEPKDGGDEPPPPPKDGGDVGGGDPTAVRPEFVDFEDSELGEYFLELEVGTDMYIDLPEIYGGEGVDESSITVEFEVNWQDEDWITYDEDSREISLEPTTDSSSVTWFKIKLINKSAGTKNEYMIYMAVEGAGGSSFFAPPPGGDKDDGKDGGGSFGGFGDFGGDDFEDFGWDDFEDKGGPGGDPNGGPKDGHDFGGSDDEGGKGGKDDGGKGGASCEEDDESCWEEQEQAKAGGSKGGGGKDDGGGKGGPSCASDDGTCQEEQEGKGGKDDSGKGGASCASDDESCQEEQAKNQGGKDSGKGGTQCESDDYSCQEQQKNQGAKPVGVSCEEDDDSCWEEQKNQGGKPVVSCEEDDDSCWEQQEQNAKNGGGPPPPACDSEDSQCQAKKPPCNPSEDSECEDEDEDDIDSELEEENAKNQEALDALEAELQSGFDPTALWEAKEELASLFAGDGDDDDDDDDDEFDLDEIPEEGEVEVPEVTASGECAVRFNQPMYIKELFDKFNIGLAGPEAAVSTGFTDSTADDRRLQATETSIGLSQLMLVYLVRGSVESAPYQDLGFSIGVNSYDEYGFDLKFNFENPQSVSLGRSPDILVMNILQPELFVTKARGESMLEKKPQEIELPRQFTNGAEKKNLEAASQSIETAANAAAGGNLVLSIFFSVSLKSLWNLNHTVQILIFLLKVAEWPANTAMVIEALQEATSFSKLLEPVFDFMEDKTQLGLFDRKLDDGTQRSDSTDPSQGMDKNILRNLAIYGVVFLGLILVLLLILICKLCPGTLKKHFQKVIAGVKKKIFWNAVIRFFIEGCLKLSLAAGIYLSAFGSFATQEDASNTLVQCGIIVMLGVWLFASYYVPIYHRDELTSPQFIEKYGSFSGGYKTTYATQFLYLNFFTIRRYSLVIVLIFLSDQRYFMIIAFMAIYSTQLVYAIEVEPFDDKVTNFTMKFNETCFILLHYTMFFLMTTTFIDPADQWSAGTVALGIIVIQFMFNFVLLVRGMLIQTRLNKRLFSLRTKNEKIAKRQAVKLRKQQKLDKVQDGDINLDFKTVYNICKDQSTTKNFDMMEKSQIKVPETKSRDSQEEHVPQKMSRREPNNMTDYSILDKSTGSKLLIREEDQSLNQEISFAQRKSPRRQVTFRDEVDKKESKRNK